MTTLDLIEGSLRLLGVLASGETPSAAESQDALTSLNDMIDTWSTESLLVYAITEDVLTLVGSQQSYTMGTGGDFDTTRPQRIINAAIRQTSGSETVDLPVEIINNDQWASLSVKTTESSIPAKLYPEYTYPLATLQLWPMPNAASSLVLWSWKPFTAFSTINTTISLPPGHAKALRYNLALELAPEYGKEPSALIVAQAIESKAAIKRMNNKPSYMQIDEAVLPLGGTFNYLTGE